MKIESRNDFELHSCDLLNLGNALRNKASQYEQNLKVLVDVEPTEGHTETIGFLNKDMLYTRMMNFHFNKSFIFNAEKSKHIGDIITFDEILSFYFMPLWNDYKHKNIYNWERIIQARYKEWNPIENYDRYENSITDYKGSEKTNTTKDGAEKTELLKDGTEKNTREELGKELSTNEKQGEEISSHHNDEKANTSEIQRAPFDSSNYTNYEKTLNNQEAFDDSDTLSFEDRKDISSIEFSNRKTIDALSFEQRKDESTLSFLNRIDSTIKEYLQREDETTSHIHGNIGVVDAPTMISNLSKLYMDNFADYVLDEFINTYCTYLHSGDI